jgi:murein peptide amidase A
VKRLGINKGRYHGERLDIAEYLQGFHAAATLHGWTAEHFATIENFKLHGYRRTPPTPIRRIYISTGMHGDEPGGPVALRRLVEENLFPPDADITLCPCINPTGLALKTRENKNGIDLNRDYRHLQTAEVRAHTNWLNTLPNFDLTLILHEDWEADGYYLYEVNPNSLPSPAQKIIQAVREICPIQTDATIDQLWQCQSGIIHPNIPPTERPLWAEAVYLIVNKTKLSLTLEAPSDFPLPFRAQAHLRALRAALHNS